MAAETIFTMDTSSIKYGKGATREIGFDMSAQGCKRVMVVTDPSAWRRPTPVRVVLDSLKSEGIEAVLFDRVRVEPTDVSFKEAIDFAVQEQFDGYRRRSAAVRAWTLPRRPTSTPPIPADLLDLRQRADRRGTAGARAAQAAHRHPDHRRNRQRDDRRGDLRPDRDARQDRHRPPRAAPDPGHHRSRQHAHAAADGGRLLRARRAEPRHRVAHGDPLRASEPAPEHPRCARPIRGPTRSATSGRPRRSRCVARIYRPRHGRSRRTKRHAARCCWRRRSPELASATPGVHLPHGMSYPVSGMVSDYVPEGYPRDHPMVPHGMSVILNAPAVFRFTAEANPERHLYAASLLGVNVSDTSPSDAGEVLSNAIIDIMRRTGMPNGLRAVGFDEEDVDQLVAGTLPQHRVTKLSPRPASESDLKELFLDAMAYW